MSDVGIGIITASVGFIVGMVLFAYGSKPNKENLIIWSVFTQISTVSATFYYFGIWWGIVLIVATIFSFGFVSQIVEKNIGILRNTKDRSREDKVQNVSSSTTKPRGKSKIAESILKNLRSMEWDDKDLHKLPPMKASGIYQKEYPKKSDNSDKE